MSNNINECQAHLNNHPFLKLNEDIIFKSVELLRPSGSSQSDAPKESFGPMA
jgi:hypothetical protein